MFNIRNIILGWGNTIINIFRQEFKVTDDYFQQLLAKHYDNEIKNKYIPELHQTSDFERRHLTDIIDFDSTKHSILNQIETCLDYLGRYKKSYNDFYQIIDLESIKIINPTSAYITNTTDVFKRLDDFESSLNILKTIFENNGYKLFQLTKQLVKINHGIVQQISYDENTWKEFLDKKTKEYYEFAMFFRNYNQVYYNINELNLIIDKFTSNKQSKIIAGDAGTGKTHLSAYLVNTIIKNNEFVIFLKSKSFNGDNVNFDDEIIKLLNVPQGYNLSETLKSINDFCITKEKRCFIIIDALNETTKSNIGFSNIWNIYLDGFINQICLFSNLYFVCTIRRTYIEKIWNERPPNICELKGFENEEDIIELCEKYFQYYKIIPQNFYSADLSYFSNPLLLDLFCKFTNESRLQTVKIELNINSYLTIFEDYINKLIKEVKKKLNLQLSIPISDGINLSSAKFLAANEAQISPDSFTLSFDKDILINADKSIARAVLEGYLIFIKDSLGKSHEFIKHTQQEIGGYLLAKKLSEDFPEINDLFKSEIFNTKIIGTDEKFHHQLRFDILKFLIALRPEIIKLVTDIDSVKLSWWYLYNGYNKLNDSGISFHLLTLETSEVLTTEILDISFNQWFNPINELNFNFISKILLKKEQWEYDLSWTNYIYQNSEYFFEIIYHFKNNIQGKEYNLSQHLLVVKCVSLMLSTTIRELRDEATIYLIEFGKKHPLELLEITIESLSFKDSYIYERLVSCCYGIALIKQNDNEYIDKYLPIIAKQFFNVQFDENTKNSVYNYIVIDSIKHLLDLAILKGAFTANEEQKRRILNYIFNPPFDWKQPSNEVQKVINECSEMNPPEPIRLDFFVYTIPRLINDSSKIKNSVARANVFKRIFELGYKNSEFDNTIESSLRKFIGGQKLSGVAGKIDRLGKKYSWNAFYDYAGFLLLNKKLNTYDKYNSGKKYYERLSDVDIDICLPSKDYKQSLKLYNGNLFEGREVDTDWVNRNHIDSIKELFDTKINDGNYTMLYGLVEENLNKKFKTRSFIMVETFFISKTKYLEHLDISNIVFDWNKDVHIDNDSVYGVYFGELYWADTMPDLTKYNVGIPTGKTITIERELSIREVVRMEGSDNDIGKIITEEVDERFLFEAEPTLLRYGWETNSKTLDGFAEYFPSSNMGKYLNLKADPSSTQILDKDLKVAFSCITFKDDDNFENSFNYMRKDLLKEYMEANNLALVYQVKQHTYTENSNHNRIMKFFIY